MRPEEGQEGMRSAAMDASDIPARHWKSATVRACALEECSVSGRLHPWKRMCGRPIRGSGLDASSGWRSLNGVWPDLSRIGAGISCLARPVPDRGVAPGSGGQVCLIQDHGTAGRAPSQIGVLLPFRTHGGVGAVAREHSSAVGQGHDQVPDGTDEILMVAAGKI